MNVHEAGGLQIRKKRRQPDILILIHAAWKRQGLGLDRLWILRVCQLNVERDKLYGVIYT